MITPMPSHPLTLLCPSGTVGGGAGSPVAVSPGIFSSEVSVMLPVCAGVCVCVSMPVCVEGKMCCRHSGPLEPRCKSPGLLSKERQLSLTHYIEREREKAGERDQTDLLDISSRSICLAENYPQLSAPISLRKRGPAGPLELNDGRIHQTRLQKQGQSTEKAWNDTSVWVGPRPLKVVPKDKGKISGNICGEWTCHRTTVAASRASANIVSCWWKYLPGVCHLLPLGHFLPQDCIFQSISKYNTQQTLPQPTTRSISFLPKLDV